MKVLHDYDKMPPNYANLYYSVRFESGKQMHKMVTRHVKGLAAKSSANAVQLQELELFRALLPYKYDDEDIHPNFDNFHKYFRKTKRTTSVETRRKINLLFQEKDFIHAHSEVEVTKFKEIIQSLGNAVMEEINELVLAEENRIKNYQQSSSKRKRVGRLINRKLAGIAPGIIEEPATKDNFFSKLKFRKNNIGFFITPNIGKDIEIVTEYVKKGKKSLCLNMDDLDDENDNYFITFPDLDDQMFMRAILNRRFMKEPLEGVKLLGNSLPVIIQHCKFDGLNICEPEWHELDFNEYYESIKKGIFSFKNRIQIKTFSEDSIRYVVKQLMFATKLESELHLACYLHYNYLLPLQKYVDKREEYFEKNNIAMSPENFKAKREDIYQWLILEGKANIKWKNEADLYKLVLKNYPDALYQYRADWLEKQSLDIYIPSLKVGIEYQGQQHYEPIEFFGGEEAFKYRQKLDTIKLQKCRKNEVKLLYWDYKDAVSKTNLSRKMEQLRKDL